MQNFEINIQIKGKYSEMFYQDVEYARKNGISIPETLIPALHMKVLQHKLSQISKQSDNMTNKI